MQSSAVAIFVWGGKAYFPAQGLFKSGIHVNIEPVYEAGLTVDEFVSAAEKVLAHGVTQLPNPTREELGRYERSILAAMKVPSSRALARKGTTYSIAWTDAGIQVDMALPGRDGSWDFDPAKVRTFPLETPLRDVMTIILEDIRSRPELK